LGRTAEKRNMTDARLQLPERLALRRGGFTLTEILIVIGLILLVIVIAIPALSVISGGRSVDAAQNQISAALARARQDAMALQEPRGIIFFPDADTGRTVLAEVYYNEFRNNVYRLELLPDRAELELPVGIGCQVFPHANTGGGTPPFPTVGVIMFDGVGRLSSRQFYIKDERDQITNQENQLWRRIRVPTTTPPFLGQSGPSPVTSQVGVLLYDLAGYNDAADKAAFLNDNATPLLLNRYNAALLPNR
jgi:type II secretory pathway pseudopilin PulG